MRSFVTMVAIALILPVAAFAVIANPEVSAKTAAESWSEIVCTKKPDELCTIKRPPPRVTAKMPFGIRAPLRDTASFKGTGVDYSTPTQKSATVAQN